MLIYMKGLGTMAISIFVVIAIILAVSERVIYKKKTKSWDKIRVFIGVLIAFMLFLISYFITDSNAGIFFVFSTISLYILIGLVHNRSDIEWLKYLVNIVGLPLLVYLFYKTHQHMLIKFTYILLTFLILNAILTYSYKRKWTIRENISYGIGILIVALMFYSFYKMPDFDNKMMLKQEIVAQKFLEEELGFKASYVYLNTYNSGLRGQESTVRAYDGAGNEIIMKYKNNKIVDYKKIGSEISENKLDETVEDLHEFYFEPNISRLEGKLTTRMHYGPPGYGENPETDAKEYPFILKLDQPIDVFAKKDDTHNSDKFQINEIQLSMGKEDFYILEKQIDKRVRVEGTLFEAITGHHYTDVIMSVEKVLD